MRMDVYEVFRRRKYLHHGYVIGTESISHVLDVLIRRNTIGAGEADVQFAPVEAAYDLHAVPLETVPVRYGTAIAKGDGIVRNGEERGDHRESVKGYSF